MANYKLDITKEHCPMTFVKTKIQLSKIAKGDILEVLVREGEPLDNIPKSSTEQGFEVLGIPCNQFMGQEPGSDEEIQSFCSTKYNVSFPMTGKIDVNGETRDPLYTFLAGDNATFSGDIQWNFEKFLIAKDGSVLKRFSPKTEPDDADLIASLEAALS